MSSTSPNFGLVLASTSDVVSVTSHIANNFSSLDSIIGAVHTGTGQLRSSINIPTPVLINPVISGSVSGGAYISASTGNFSTVTATGGALTVNTFNVGTYSYPGAIGSTGFVLTVVTGNVAFAANTPSTGANAALSNLAVVAINTNMNTFTAGFVTMARVIATSGALTGLTSFQATTGTFAGNLIVSGTATVNVINATGGTITAGGFAIGTYGYPATVGVTGAILTVTTGNLVFVARKVTGVTEVFSAMAVASQALATGSTSRLAFTSEVYDPGNNMTTGAYTAPSSGVYSMNFGNILIAKVNGTAQTLAFGILINTTGYNFYTPASASATAAVSGSLVAPVGSGEVVSVYWTASGAIGGAYLISDTLGGAQGAAPVAYFAGNRLYEL